MRLPTLVCYQDNGSWCRQGDIASINDPRSLILQVMKDRIFHGDGGEGARMACCSHLLR